MAAPLLSSGQYTPGMANDATSHNAVLDPIIAAINNHTHNPNDSTAGYGAGLDSSSSAIAANPSEPVAYPTSGSGVGTYIPVTPAQGIEQELSRIRGQLARLTGGNWYDNIGAIVQYDPGTTNLTTPGGSVMAANFVSTATGITPPFSILSSAKVTNLNADLLDGANAVSAQSSSNPLTFAGAIPIADNSGHIPIGMVPYDSSEAATNDTLTPGTSSIVNSLNRIRYALSGWSVAAGGVNWNDSPSGLLTSISNYQGTPRTGGVVLKTGSGVMVSEERPGTYRFDLTGSGPTAPSGLTIGDMFADSTVSGMNVVAAGGLNVSVTHGIGIVNGQRAVLQYDQTIGPLTAATTNWIYWNGGSGASSFTILTGASQPSTPAGTIPLASIPLAGGASSVGVINDMRPTYNTLNSLLEAQNYLHGYNPSSNTGSETTTFNTDGSITQTLLSGMVVSTTFNNDGSISETYSGGPFTVPRTKTTTISGLMATETYA